MDRNGYYRVSQREDGIYIEQIPPEGNGIMIPVDVLVAYLSSKKIAFDNLVELKKGIEKASKGGKVRISALYVPPFSGWCKYINQSNIALQAVIYPPMVGCQKLSKEEILADLRGMNVVHGIKEDVIEKAIKEERYFEVITIAEGTPPVEGSDAMLKYNFNVDITAKPTVKDDGSVDFHQLDIINHVKAGDVVAEITPEVTGKSGTNIIGNPIYPRKVIKRVFKYGKNLEVSPDGTKLISLVSGQVTLEGEKVTVSDEFVVRTDVDTTTGDIDFNGNVTVIGSVRAGFRVNATGNVRVDGVVEGAEIIAGGDIVLQRGIHGMNHGVLKAGGSVVAPFIENASVSAGEDIESNAILHSKVSAGRTINVHGRNGFIVGGNIRAGLKIEAKTIGSEMETVTILSVGTNPEQIAEINLIKKQIADATKVKELLNQKVEHVRKKKESGSKLNELQLEAMHEAMKNLVLISQQINELKNHYMEITESVYEDSEARVKINGTIYPGVKLEFGDQSLFIRDKFEYCQYAKLGADITLLSL